MPAAVWIRVLLLSVIWGCSFFCMKIALAELPPMTIVAARLLLAVTALGTAGLLLRRLAFTGPVLLACLGMGLLNNLLPFFLIAWAQQHLGSGLGSVLNATTPLMTALVAHALTVEERLTLPRLAGTVLSAGGVAMLLLPGNAGTISPMAAGAALLAALSQALAATFGRRFARLGVTPVAAATGQVGTAAVLALLLALVVDHPWTLSVPSAPVLAAVLALGLVCTGFAFALFFAILQRAGAYAASLAIMLVPVMAMLLGALLLGERLAPPHWLGAALVLTGLAVVNVRLPPWSSFLSIKE